MKVRPSSPQSLKDFSLLSFDCFGTLVDWRSGIYAHLTAPHPRLPASSPLKNSREALIDAFNDEEVALCNSRPGLLYPTLLSDAYKNLCSKLSLPAPSEAETEALGNSVGDWPPFPDTVQALNRLKKHYRLVILSNVDNASFDKVLAGPLKEVAFDAVYTAQDIGTYKPDHNNFNYLFEHVKQSFGVERQEVLHTGHGLKADHVPAKEMGFTSAWIARGDAAGGEGTEVEATKGKVEFTWQFETMGDMAEAADESFGGK